MLGTPVRMQKQQRDKKKQQKVCIQQVPAHVFTMESLEMGKRAGLQNKYMVGVCERGLFSGRCVCVW